MFSSNTSQVASTNGALAEAIDFDGTNDYLSRANLTGNTSSATFTFSAWVWPDNYTSVNYIYYSSRVEILIYNGNLQIFAKNSAGTNVLVFQTPLTGQCFDRTWNHFLVSINLSSTSFRSVYINDILVSPTWSTYTIGASIAFSQSIHQIGFNGSSYTKARLSNVFLDYTYRDMSITANRRLFITADLKPAAGQAALNPIMYVPMSDPTQPGLNQGTGGNFTLTGVVARSGRGPNQYNAPYSDLDGSANYLNKSSLLTGISDSKTFTLSFVLNADVDATHTPICFTSSGVERLRVVRYSSTKSLEIRAYNVSGVEVLVVESAAGSCIPGRNYQVVISVDLTSTSNRHFYINGVATSATWGTYTNDLIDFNCSTPNYLVGTNADNTIKYNGKIGALWFNTSYINLSVATNLAKFVSGTGINAAPVDLGASGELPTGTSPLAYLPMYGNNAGRNYGTGGNFTVVSGPYTGARGPNEFWGNWAVFNDTDYLLRSSISLSTNTITLSFFINITDNSPDSYVFDAQSSGNSARFRCTLNAARYLRLEAWNSSDVKVLDVQSNITLNRTTTYHVAISFNLSNSAQRHFYIDNTDVASSWSTYSSGTMAIAKTYISSNNAPLYDSRLAEFYLSTTYVDFSQEANRLKFRDAFGYPTDLPSAITAATVPTPAIYMRFPPTAFGTNSGTGGNFTVNGTITDGGQL